MKNIRFVIRTNDHTATAFKHLPPTFINDGVHGVTQYTQVPDDEVGYVLNGFCNNPDIVLTSSASSCLTDHRVRQLGRVRTLALDRYPKAVYNALLNHHGHDLPGYIPLRCWSNTGSFAPHEDKAKYLLRPQFGARGLGFIVLDLQTKSLESVMETLSIARGSSSAEKFFEILDNAKLQYTTQGKTDLADLYNVMWQKYDLVKVVPSVKEEYRIVTNHLGNIGLVTRRTRTETVGGLMQARGCNQDVSETMTISEWDIAPALKQSLVRFFDRINLPLNSFDLFLTESGWGFFEACSEFGHTSLPTGWVAVESMALLDHVANVEL